MELPQRNNQNRLNGNPKIFPVSMKIEFVDLFSVLRLRGSSDQPGVYNCVVNIFVRTVIRSRNQGGHEVSF